MGLLHGLSGLLAHVLSLHDPPSTGREQSLGRSNAGAVAGVKLKTRNRNGVTISILRIPIPGHVFLPEKQVSSVPLTTLCSKPSCLIADFLDLLWCLSL